jgi:hypothetical protein
MIRIEYNINPVLSGQVMGRRALTWYVKQKFCNLIIQSLIIVACIFIIEEKWLMIKIHDAFLLLRLRMSLIVYSMDYETVALLSHIVIT